MTERCEDNEYIKCNKRWCKYINDDEHVKQDYEYNRLEEIFKTCVKCRERGNVQNNTYRETHKEEITERKQDYDKQYYQEH